MVLKNIFVLHSCYQESIFERMVNMRSTIYRNLLLMALVISSYVGLLFFISNEGLKNPSALPRHRAIDAEMMEQSTDFADADFQEIQLNKKLIDLK